MASIKHKMSVMPNVSLFGLLFVLFFSFSWKFQKVVLHNVLLFVKSKAWWREQFFLFFFIFYFSAPTKTVNSRLTCLIKKYRFRNVNLERLFLYFFFFKALRFSKGQVGKWRLLLSLLKCYLNIQTVNTTRVGGYLKV